MTLKNFKTKTLFNGWEFCPRCGVKCLKRDYYKTKKLNNSGGALEYICNLCGIGFRVEASKRYVDARNILRESPTQRAGSSRRVPSRSPKEINFRSTILCQHVNETSKICDCPTDCGCREFMCLN